MEAEPSTIWQMTTCGGEDSLQGKVTFDYIGVVRTPFKEARGTPISTAAGCGVKGTIELNPEYQAGLQDIAGFSHLFLIYHMDRVDRKGLTGIPFLDDKPHGVFAMRSPLRPNHIGLSVVRLTGVRDKVLDIQDLDILDGTPLLDIKPYLPEFDGRTGCRTGWFAENLHKMNTVRDDGRYAAK
jgi:tRNA (adenine37-N6)-methyltransferase